MRVPSAAPTVVATFGRVRRRVVEVVRRRRVELADLRAVVFLRVVALRAVAFLAVRAALVDFRVALTATAPSSPAGTARRPRTSRGGTGSR
ncbi:hypothetical protein GCM10009845_17780 [Pedococcus bigeumensis]